MERNKLIHATLDDAFDYFQEHRNADAINKIKEAWELVPCPQIAQSCFGHFIGRAHGLCAYRKLFVLGNQLISLYFNYTRITSRQILYELPELEHVSIEVGLLAYEEHNLEVAKYTFWMADYVSEKIALSDTMFRQHRRLAEGKTKIEFENTLRGRTYKTIEVLGKDQEVLVMFESVLEQWDNLPEPKLLQDESYTIVKAFIKLCIEHELYQLGNSTISLLFISGINLSDQGERAFIAGELAYAQGLLEIAKQNFYVANLKSKGTCFSDGNQQYSELLHNDHLEFKLNDEEAILKVSEEAGSKKAEPLELSEKEHKKVMKLYKKAEKLSPPIALEKFEEVLDMVPMCEENSQIINLLYAAIGDTQVELNQYKEALDSFYNIYNTGVFDNPYVLFKMGICYYELGNLSQATEFFMRTYMVDEYGLFDSVDSKYFETIKDLIN